MIKRTVLRQFEICQRLGISDESWRRYVRSGRAPEPLPGWPVNCPRWSVEDVEAFERRRVSGVRLTPRRYVGSRRSA